MQLMKKSVCNLSVACAMLLSALTLNYGSADVTVNAELEKTASQIVEEITFGWNLGNSLDSYGSTAIGSGSLSTETSWGNPTTTKEMIDLVKDSGINAVRVPVTWYNHMNNDYVIDVAWMNRVEEVVNYVIDNDMYCIVNVHHDTGEKGWLKASSNNLDQKKAMFTAIWEQVSENFADYGDRLMFEGFNEILNDSNEWVNPNAEAVSITNELNQIFVDIVRKSGGNNSKRNLIVTTYCAGGNSQVTNGFVLPKDTVNNRLIVDAHIYQPFYFTSEFYPEVTTWGKSELNSYLTNMYTTFVQKGIPVIIGEFGCVEKGNATERLSWAKYYVETCTNYGMKCFWWDNGDQYKIFNRKTLNVAEPELLNTMLAEAKGEIYVPDTNVIGDANGDGIVTIEDVKLLQDYLLCTTDTISMNADVIKDNVIDCLDLVALKRMAINLGNLCADVGNWSRWINEEGGAAASVDYLQNGISIKVTQSGEEEWYIQGSYADITLEKGAKYQISFDYSASKDISLYFHLQQNYDPYGLYASDFIDYTTKMQHYTSTFTMSDETDKNVVWVFNCGGRDESVPFTMTVTNLSLIKIS